MMMYTNVLLVMMMMVLFSHLWSLTHDAQLREPSNWCTHVPKIRRVNVQGREAGLLNSLSLIQSQDDMPDSQTQV